MIQQRRQMIHSPYFYSTPLCTLWSQLSTAYLAKGMELDLYGRLVVLTGCDAFTRSHLASEGIELAAQEPPPTDPYEVISLLFFFSS
jgi:hypothetical protein